MKVLLVPSAVADPSATQCQFVSSYLINDTVAVDGGCLGFYGTPQEQARVKHVFLTHSHIDHIGSVPVFVENAFEGRRDCVTVHGSTDVLECLQKDIFNDRLWPDFIRLSTEKAPFLKLNRLEAGKTVEAEGLRITPVPVNHVVPTFGMIVDDGSAAVVFSADTAPTEELWQRANATPNLRAVFLEATFPESLTWLADAAKHLTPAMFQRELQKLKLPARIVAVHLKARYRAEVTAELEALGLPNVEIGRFGTPYII